MTEFYLRCFLGSLIKGNIYATYIEKKSIIEEAGCNDNLKEELITKISNLFETSADKYTSNADFE